MIKKLIFILFIIQINYAQEILHVGALTGIVVDAESKQPLPGVTVTLKGTSLGATTNAKGEYRIERLKVGNYVAVFSYVGYKTIIQPDIIIKSEKTIYVDKEMFASFVEIKGVEVRGNYFAATEAKPLGAVQFSSEEIRRAPGAVGDVSRILFSLPSVAKVNDGKNSLMVRGGSPVENSFYLDNIEIPNINHFPTGGSSDGLMGILNVDFVKDLTFYSGGFSPIYGDKLSSVMEISYREGDKNKYSGQLNLNYGGVGAQFEGPINNKGAFFVSVNKSYLDLAMKTFADDYPAPAYYDAQTKVTYSLSNNHKLSLIGVFADDIYDYNQAKAIKSEMNYYGRQNNITNTTGLNWLFIWGSNGYSNTTISNTYSKKDINLFETKSQNSYIKNGSTENEFKFRNVSYLKFNDKNKLEFGAELKYGINKFEYVFGSYLNNYGQTINGSKVAVDLNTLKSGAFVVYNMLPIEGLTMSPGARIDYFDYNKKALCAPRFSMSYALDPTTTINAATGVFYQNIPSLILAQSNLFKNLATPKAIHYSVGISRLLTENTKLSVEIFRKNYSNFPIDPNEPEQFLFDEIVTTGIFSDHAKLVSGGKSYSQGVEFLIQKKLAENFYGMISMSYSKVKYQDLNGVWRDRIYDNRFNFSVDGGYKPNDLWEFSARWVYAGGIPYTPYDAKRSQEENRGIYDLGRINASRLPDYHSLNLRVDKRFYFDKTNLVLFLSVWNVYNRENVSAYNWNEVKNKSGKETGWSALPIIGAEYEF